MASRPKSILIIENNETEREELAGLLTAMGYNVEKASGSDEGLKLFNQNRHDLVIIEVPDGEIFVLGHVQSSGMMRTGKMLRADS